MVKYALIPILFLMVSCHVEKKTAISQVTLKDSTPQTEDKVTTNPDPTPTIETPKKQEKTVLGIQVLQQINFDILQGKRVGLVTNPTGVDSHLKSTIDIFHESDKVNLVALFSPEHGVRGNFSAGDLIENQTDPKTGIPVFSLYGKNKRPDKAAMDLLDVLVYDIQDIGVRSYTFISTLGMIMEVAAEYGNYNSDLTRTIPVNGTYTKRQKEVYNSVLRVHKAAIKMLRPSVVYFDFQKEIEKLMEAELLKLKLIDKTDIKNQSPESPAFRKYFYHGTSHMLGLDVHDVGNMHDKVQVGSVWTVEPGIYIKEEKFGVRIENNIVIGKKGNIDLMRNIPIEADEIEEIMNTKK